jgi:hypothetical protein
MKNAALIFPLLIFCLCSSAQKSDSFVLYNQEIGWHLFKGVPNSDSLDARISTSINLEVIKVDIWDGSILFKAYAVMYPFNSWVKPDYADRYTLQHVQGHFNVTELCARKLQAELNRMKIKSRKSSTIQTIAAKWQKEMEEMQKPYDLETKGANGSTAQKCWNDRLLIELNGT